MKSATRIIQTFWTKPMYDGKTFGSTRANCGWNSRKYNYFSWALSCLMLNKFYEEVILITDKNGENLLINLLDLPYSKVFVELDFLDYLPSSLWTLPKLFSYKLQKDTFIHVDGDVYIWKKFGSKIEQSSLCAQQLVINHIPQYFTILEVEQKLNYIPNEILEERKSTDELFISSAGIIGGSNLEFIHKYANEAIRFVFNNLDNINKLTSGNFGMIYEEYLFYCMAKKCNINIDYLLEPMRDNYKGISLIDFDSIPFATSFIHPVGQYKKYEIIGKALEKYLMVKYPYYYYKILKRLYDFDL